jgi:hypothetical protein
MARGSIKNQAKVAYNAVNGIGSSKKASRENDENEYKGENGHDVSELIHSFKGKDQFIRLTKNILTHQKVQFNITPDLHNITKEHINSYVNELIEKGLKYNSISTYLSQVNKLSIAISKIPDKASQHVKDKRGVVFTPKDVKQARKTAKEQAIGNIHINRSYSNTDAIGAYLDGKTALSFRLQKDYGLRVTAATKISPMQLKANNKFEFVNKGGKLQTITIDKNLHKQLKESTKIGKGHLVPYNLYIKELKQAMTQTGQKWQGTHGLRYSYAQTKFDQYQKDGLTAEQARQKVSNDLGHNRIDITDHYLKG